MMEQEQADATTADTQAQEDSPVRVKSYGDPVIVDDGGSIRIERRGSSWTGHVSRPPTPGARPARQIFRNNSLLCVFALTANGPFCASVPLLIGDIITTTAGTDTVTLTLEDAAGKTENLKVVSSAAADNYTPGNANHRHEHFHVPSDSLISKVTLDRSGATTVVLDASIHGATSMTFVSVHPA